jgi:NADH-quinone oxidoreductase subunit M
MLMASVGLPLTIGFVGEFLSLLGFYRVSPIMALIAGSTIILGAVYMLVLFKKSFFGPVTNKANETLKDLNGKELTALIPLVMLVVILGVYPKPLLSTIDKSVTKMVDLMQKKVITTEAKDLLKRVNNIGEVTK